ncbi:MAG: hypothetical protein IPM29_24930 [Planctomycetes bacterium]|nr:hypothetical protein [Planctomycetota bacterium]
MTVRPPAGSASHRGTASDLLHPLVFRELRRSFRTRAYLLTIGTACVAMLVIALIAADRELNGVEVSQWTLRTSLQVLVPVLLVAIPMQAHLALREETFGHTADQLVLAGLRPAGVVLGLVATAVLQCGVFTGFFAPLLAFSYLLLGVDARTIVECIALAVGACLVTTSAALAGLRLARFGWLRPHVTVLVLAALGALAVVVIGNMDALLAAVREDARSGRQFWLALQQIATISMLLATFLGLLAAGSLTPHPEARAIGFRLVGLAAAPTCTLAFGAGVHGGLAAMVATAPFWFLATTEPLTLTRRQLALVPRGSRRRQLAMAPLLPGAGRGVLYAAAVLAACVLSGIATEWSVRGAAPTRDGVLRLAALAALGIGYAAWFCRHRLHGVETSRLATTQARLGLARQLAALWFFALVLDGWAVGLGGAPLALASSLVPFAHLAAPQYLPPALVLLAIGATLGGMLLAPALPAVRFGLRELRDPGQTPIPRELRARTRRPHTRSRQRRQPR